MTEVAAAYVSLEPTVSKGFRRTVESEVGAAGDSASSSFTRRFGRRTESDAGKIGARVGGSFKASFGKAVAGLGALFAGQKALGFISDSIAEAREAQKVGAVTEQIIRSTGKAANVTANQVGRLATKLSLKAGVDDEAIQTGANLLLTFKNVRNEVGRGNKIFNMATAAAVDLSAAGFGSIDSASKMLGKALNDPIKGITALSRAGVTFTDQQKSQIKTLVEQGKTLEAQKIILGEVRSQVGGVAAASATAGQKASVAWGNLKEQLGGLLLPIIDRVATALYSKVIPAISGFISQMQSGQGAGGAFADALGSIRDVVADVAGVIAKTFGPVVERVTTFMRENPAVVKAFAIALGVLSAAIGVVTLATAAFSLALNSTGIPLVIIAIAALVAGLVYAYQHSSKFREIVQQLGAILQQVGAFIRDQIVPVIVDLAQKVATNLQPVWAALVEFFTGSVLPVVQQLLTKFQSWMPTIQRVIGVVVSLVAKWVDFYTSMIGKVLPVVLKIAGFLIRTLVPAVANVIGVLVRVVGKVLDFGAALVGAAKKIGEFASKVKAKIDKVISWFTGLPGQVTSALGDVGSLLLDTGKQIINGLWNGLKQKWEDVKKWLGSVTKSFPKIKGPPAKDKKLLFKSGQLIMGGLQNGLRHGWGGIEKSLEQITNRLSTFIDKKKVGKKVAGQMTRVVDRISSAFQGVTDAVSRRDDIAGSVASNLMGEFDLSAIFAKNQFGLSQGANVAVQIAQSMVSRLRGFAAQLTQLVAAGLPGPLVQEVASLGSVEGKRVADVLLRGGAGAVSAISGAFNDFQATTRSIGMTVGNAVAGGDIAKAEQDLAAAIRDGLAALGLVVNVDVGKQASLEIVKKGTKHGNRRK